MDRQVQRGKEWLETLLGLMGLPAEVKVETPLEPGEEPSIWLAIDSSQLQPEQVELSIGSQGAGIDAIQYLVNTEVNLGLAPEDQRAFTVELNGYRRQRQAELMAWAREVAECVRQTGQEVEMKSLSSAERRQVHTFLKDEPDLETESRGQEPDRRLVVRLR